MIVPLFFHVLPHAWSASCMRRPFWQPPGSKSGLCPVSSFRDSCPSMQRSVCFVAAALALYGASCFVAPSTVGAAPEVSREAVRGQALAAPEATSSSSAFSPLALGAAFGLLLAVATGRPALAADVENGASIFAGNCAACHAGGNNSVVPEKKIKKEALVQYGKYDVAAIIKQVIREGKRGTQGP